MLVRQLLLAAVAIERGDRAVTSILGRALHEARRLGLLNTVIMTSAEVSDYLIEHAAELLPNPFIEKLSPRLSRCAPPRTAPTSPAGRSSSP